MVQLNSQQGSEPRSQDTAENASPVELSVQYHAGNPSLCRVPDLKIGVMPECEGGGWYMPRAQAELVVKAVNAHDALVKALKDAQRIIERDFPNGQLVIDIRAALTQANL